MPKSQLAKTRHLLSAVLRSTATKREAKQYVQRYTSEGPLRVAIVRLSPEVAEEASSIGRTLAHMLELGSNPIVILEPADEVNRYLAGSPFAAEAQKLLNRADEMVDKVQCLGKCPARAIAAPFSLSLKKGLKPDWARIIAPLESGTIPLISPIVYDEEYSELQFTPVHDTIISLVEEIRSNHDSKVVVDKVIFVDSLGGLPSSTRNSAHIQVNVKQEQSDIATEIMSSSHYPPEMKAGHLRNLKSMCETLLEVPSSHGCTGIITTPQAATATLDRNPIIYNILTDRPLISSSLPIGLERSQLATTILRKGQPVHVLQAEDSEHGLDLKRLAKSGQIHLGKLVNLIEASFRRKLDVNHYMARLENSVAAIIIVGDYDGAAILSYETAASGRKIPYLDKLAVHPHAQGSAGVADILLNRMMRNLYPHELVWRSRASNPVNKWYFERSSGFHRLKGTEWTMFWHGQGDPFDLEEYISICRDIEPSLYN